MCASTYPEKLINNLKQEIEALKAEIETLKKINANLMGDDENVPRYTNKRLKQEVARMTEYLSHEIDILKVENKRLQKRINNYSWDIDALRSEVDRHRSYDCGS